MGKSKSVSQKLAELTAGCADAKSPAAVADLRRALEDRSNYVVKKAAQLIDAAKLKSLTSELAAAYERLTIDPEKSDPGCLGKLAVMQALVNLEYQDADFYRRGLKYRQVEGLWRGEDDPAAELRGAAAAGFAACARVIDVLSEMADLLVDRFKLARIGAARAIAQLNSPDGIPLLRLKLLTGDKDPEVLGECAGALLKLACEGGLPYVVGLLNSLDPDICIQAALALGESRRPEALEPLKQCWQRQTDASTRGIVLTCIALLRRAEAAKFLISLISADDPTTAGEAIHALASSRSLADVRRDTEAAVRATGNSRLIDLFNAEFG